MNIFIVYKRYISKISKALILLATLLGINPNAYAEAGRVIFTSGVVTAESVNGVIRPLHKRAYVESGETIRTEKNSMIQIRMIDKALIALRSNSELKIDSYNLGVTKEEDTSIFSLLKGGFRSVTGIIGKRLKSAYKLRTLTATLGIRGTDYTARICADDCNNSFGNLVDGKSIANGLYVGVNNGGVNLTNDLGTLSLDELQFGYVKDATTAPVALITAPDFLYFNSSPPNPDDEADNNEESAEQKSVVAARSAVEPDNSDVNNDDLVKKDLKAEQIEVSQEQIDTNAVVDQVAETDSGTEFSLTDGAISSSRMVVSSFGKQNAAGSIATVHSNPFSSAKFDSNNAITQFDNNYIDQTKGVGVYTSSSSTIDLGYDPTTKISWGRWSAGNTQFQPTNGSTAPPSANLSSVHWVSSPDQTQDIALPSSGVQSYQWVGNTTPTDNLGNTGILGNATLQADFNNSTVDSTVDIGINNQVWNATSSNIPIANDGGFSGNFNNVNVNTTSTNFNGSGSTAGFITNDGAGMGFALEANINGTDTTVTGTAVFQKP